MSAGLYALEKGAGSGLPIVMFHGFGGSHKVLTPIQDDLAADFRTLAFDLPGHGGSLNWDGRCVPAKMASAIWEDLDRRGIGKVHLAGHSMGGSVATLMTMFAGDRVASLTLLAPGGFGTEINSRVLRRYAVADTPETVRMAEENMFGWAGEVPDSVVARTLESRQVPGQIEKLVEIAAHITNDDKQGVLPREELAKFSMPVKVLWGTQDRVLPTRQAHRLPGHFAGHIFEDTGHMLPDEIPDAVIRLVRENVR